MIDFFSSEEADLKTPSRKSSESFMVLGNVPK